jgi:hypothetical protein
MSFSLVSLVPPLFGLAGGALAGFYSARAALRSWERSRHDMAAKQAVDLIQAVCTDLAGLMHAALWLTWKSRFEPNSFTEQDIEKYEVHSQEKMPRLMGSFAALAAVDAVTARSVRPFLDDIMELDGKVGLACVDAKQKDLSGLTDLYPETLDDYKTLFDLVGDLSARVIGKRENVVLK